MPSDVGFMHFWRVTTLAGFISIFIAIVSITLFGVGSPQKDVSHQVMKGIDFLVSEGTLSPDEQFLLGQTFLLLYGEDTATKKAPFLGVRNKGAYKLNEEILSMGMDSMLLPTVQEDSLINDEDFEAGNLQLQMPRKDMRYLSKIVHRAVLCGAGGVDYRDSSWTKYLLTAPSHGYLSTHQLFAAVTMYRKECMEKETLMPIISDLTKRNTEILMLRGVTDDLSLEQLAMLAYAGKAKRLYRLYFDAVLDMQSQDGSWGRELTIQHDFGSQIIMPAHSTVLALYFLASACHFSPDFQCVTVE